MAGRRRSATVLGRRCGAVLVLGMAVANLSGAWAESRPGFCAAAAKDVHADPHLSEAVTAVFGHVAFSSTADECTYPLKLLHYADADVLLTQGNVPGEGCHGCGAKLSAFVLRQSGGGYKLLKRFPGFAESGSNGAAGDLTGVTIGSDDGLAIEGGGTFQGYTFSDLHLYAFRAGRIVELKLVPGIVLTADDGGAMTDDSKGTSVEAKWTIDPRSKTDLVLDYKIESNGKSRQATATWSLRDTQFVLTKGMVPPEVAKASGGVE